MSKSGQARVLSPEDQARLFDEISKNRHPEKNTAIMQLSFKLGLRAQEIALLEIKEIAELGSSGDFKLLKIMALPAAYTKGADAMNRSKAKYERKTVNFKKEEFDKVIRQVEELVKAGVKIKPENFYPSIIEHKGKSRDLPMVDHDLRDALCAYLELRISKDKKLRPSDKLFITQKGGSYSPNTLQEHMALMLRRWAGIEKASSHSGRRTLITDVIHRQKKSVKVAQIIAGHVNASTTLIYEDPPETEIITALSNLGENNR